MPETQSTKSVGGTGIQSIEIGAALLEALVKVDAPASLKQLADATGMHAAKSP